MRNVRPSLQGFCVLTVVIIAPAFLTNSTPRMSGKMYAKAAV